MTFDELEEWMREVMSSILQEFPVKLVHVISEWLKKLVANTGTHIKFKKISMRYAFFSYSFLKN